MDKHASHPAGLLDTGAVVAVGALLFGMALVFLRFMAGSWRDLGAAFASVAVVGIGALTVNTATGGRLPRLRWWLPGIVVLFVAAGAVYGAVSSVTTAGRAAGYGGLVGCLHALAAWRAGRRKKAAYARVA